MCRSKTVGREFNKSIAVALSLCVLSVSLSPLRSVHILLLARPNPLDVGGCTSCGIHGWLGFSEHVDVPPWVLTNPTTWFLLFLLSVRDTLKPTLTP